MELLVTDWPWTLLSMPIVKNVLTSVVYSSVWKESMYQWPWQRKLGKRPMQSCRKCMERSVSWAQVYDWFKHFQNGWKNISDAHSGRPPASQIDENIADVFGNIVKSLYVGCWRMWTLVTVQFILTENLGMRLVCQICTKTAFSWPKRKSDFYCPRSLWLYWRRWKQPSYSLDLTFCNFSSFQKSNATSKDVEKYLRECNETATCNPKKWIPRILHHWKWCWIKYVA